MRSNRISTLSRGPNNVSYVPTIRLFPINLWFVSAIAPGVKRWGRRHRKPYKAGAKRSCRKFNSVLTYNSRVVQPEAKRAVSYRGAVIAFAAFPVHVAGNASKPQPCPFIWVVYILCYQMESDEGYCHVDPWCPLVFRDLDVNLRQCESLNR